jgi:hypothetical protein
MFIEDGLRMDVFNMYRVSHSITILIIGEYEKIQWRERRGSAKRPNSRNQLQMSWSATTNL